MSQQISRAPVVAIAGPTAAGKSDLAVALALRVGGEVVNADSMQIYRGMDIGTAKLSPAERRSVPHHVIDILDPTEPATVAEFQGWARVAIEDCLARGVTPIVVGGSALYLRATLDRFEFPGTDPDIRARLDIDLAEIGAERLHRRLAEIDPASAADILPSNGRRIVRALEVLELGGGFAARLPTYVPFYPDVRWVGLDVPRAVLDARIAARVDHMWADGLVTEVQALAAQLRAGRTAGRALGYAQVLRMLAGELSEDEAKDETVRKTRRFARRQDSWFRKDRRIGWLAYDDEALVARAERTCGR